MHTTQQARDDGRRFFGMCKCCGEAYVDIGTVAQRTAWMAKHGANCTRPRENLDFAVQEAMVQILAAMPPSTVSH